ncbi:MAG: hypothetical protein PHV03_09125 [Desulfitobacteriaceae bacterium]|nr:hypothetical protein [Desulfitobacteriaceae bacterium]
MKKTKLLYIIIAMLAVSQVYFIFQINSLKTKVQQTENGIAYAEDRLESNISEIYSNVDRKLEEYTSLVTNCGYEIGEFNLQTLKVPVTFKLQPKTLTETTTVFLKFSAEKILMERQGAEFVLTKAFAIKDEVFPAIIIEDKGVLQFEEHDYLRVYNIRDKVFSSLSPCFEGQSGYSAQGPYDYRMKGNIAMGSVINGDNSFKDIKYIVTLDDEVIKTYQADFVGSGNIEINDNFKMKTGQTLIGKVVATDRLNFTHEYLIMHYVAGEGEQREHYYENEKIIAPDGTAICDLDEKEPIKPYMLSGFIRGDESQDSISKKLVC